MFQDFPGSYAKPLQNLNSIRISKTFQNPNGQVVGIQRPGHSTEVLHLGHPPCTLHQEKYLCNTNPALPDLFLADCNAQTPQGGNYHHNLTLEHDNSCIFCISLVEHSCQKHFITCSIHFTATWAPTQGIVFIALFVKAHYSLCQWFRACPLRVVDLHPRPGLFDILLDPPDHWTTCLSKGLINGLTEVTWP